MDDWEFRNDGMRFFSMADKVTVAPFRLSVSGNGQKSRCAKYGEDQAKKNGKESL